MKINQSVKSVAMNVYRAVSVNVVRLLVSVVLTLLLPRVLGVEAYSYWQLYLFYGIYASFSSLGWCEGVYLSYGGQAYESLPRQRIAAQFWGLVTYELLFSAAAILVFTRLTDDRAKRLVLVLVFVSSLFEILRYSLQCILQTTGRIKAYARIAGCERLLFFALAVLCLAAGLRDFVYIILCEVLAKLVALLLALLALREVVFSGRPSLSTVRSESARMIRLGYKLLCATLASQLILGIVRFAMENKWGTITFGRISLTLSFANMIITAISAISLVIFPILKQMDEARRPELYGLIRMMLLLPLLGFLCLYPVLLALLEWWLPQYGDSLKYMAVLLPLCIYESRSLILTDTYFKAYGQTGSILQVNVAAIALSAVLTALSVYLLDSVDLAVISIVLLLLFKSALSEWMLRRCTGRFFARSIAEEALLTAVYIWSNWFYAGRFSALIYPAALLCYLLRNRRAIRDAWRRLAAMLRERAPDENKAVNV